MHIFNKAFRVLKNRKEKKTSHYQFIGFLQCTPLMRFTMKLDCFWIKQNKTNKNNSYSHVFLFLISM